MGIPCPYDVKGDVMTEMTPQEKGQDLINRYKTCLANALSAKTHAEMMKSAQDLRDLRNEMIRFREEYPDV